MKIRAYFVEDNATIRENLVDTLVELANVEDVGFSETENEASQWLANNPENWDLVIIDLFLRQGSGIGVVASVKGRLSHQKAIVLSNYATDDVRARCKELGVDAVFDKSNEIDTLVDFVQAIK